MHTVSHQKRLLGLCQDCVGLLLLACATVTAQPRYQFDHWTTENGLPQNSINDILQTRNGYLWLATYGGLVRFDGMQFVVFDRSVEGIKSQRVKALCEDRVGTLWAGTEEGMLIRYRDGKFITYVPEDRSLSNEAFRIDEDEAGLLWITGRDVVTKFDGTNFFSFPRGDFAPDANDYSRRYKVWWRQDAAGLHCLVRGRIQTYALPALWNGKILDVYTDCHGNLWVETKGAGVARLTQMQFKRFTTHEGLPGNAFTGFFLEDRKGNLWLAMHQDHSLYCIRNGKYEQMRSFPPYSFGALYEDREGNVWLGTSIGLFRLRELAITLYTEREGLSWNWVYAILQDRASAIWIGTWGGGLNKYENGHFMHFANAAGVAIDRITCLYEDPNGKLWVGANEGVSYLEKGRLKSYEDPHRWLKHDTWAMLQDHAGSFWFGTDGGLVQLQDGNFKRYTEKDGLPYQGVRSLFEDHTNALWIGTDQGIARLKDGVFTAYTEAQGFIGNQARAIHEDGDGVLWVGTYDGGLYRFKDERFTRYTTKEGLYDNGVFQILEDDAGNLWMGCNRGIYRVSRRELNEFAAGRAHAITSVVYGTKDGLATLECNGGRQPSGLKTADGKLWFPTMGGVAVIDLKAIQANTQPPPVILEEFRLDNQAIDFRNGVRVQPNQDSFEIRYTAPSFIKPEYLKFKYKLEGLDKAWIDAGNRRAANYHRIPPGHYRFMVMAANSDGVWNNEGASLFIIVVPPVWRRWWFVMLVASLFLVTPLLIYRSYSKRRWKRVEYERAAQVVFSSKLIESQEAERKRIASELHDDLGQKLLMIRNWAQVVLSKAPTDARTRKTLTDISDTALQSVEEVRRIAHHLRPHLIDSLGLTQAIKAMLNQVADAAGFRLVSNVEPIDQLFSEAGEINVYRIVQECLNNVVKHAGATEARVTIMCLARAVIIEIEDNGHGFDAQAQGATGFGLKDIAERARLLGGKPQIDSVPGKGTKVTTILPLQGGRDESGNKHSDC